MTKFDPCMFCTDPKKNCHVLFWVYAMILDSSSFVRFHLWLILLKITKDFNALIYVGLAPKVPEVLTFYRPFGFERKNIKLGLLVVW